jgi:hypothetical protein
MGSRLCIIFGAWASVPLNPGPDPGSLSSTALKRCQDVLWKGCGRAARKDLTNAPFQRLGWWVTQHRHMPVTMELEPEDGQLTGRSLEDRLLELSIGPTGRPFTAEADSADSIEVPGICLALTISHDSLLRG